MIVDLFAGPGGWSEGLRLLGLADFGLEWDDHAVATRFAAGHATWQTDIASVDPHAFAGCGVVGLIASPPCQDFSLAGKGAGRAGDRGQLIDTVPPWVEALRPEWVACEQVPPALDVWREHAELYRSFGYSTWCGVLNAADFGVPQTRRRAFLIASRVRAAGPPEPTHARDPQPTLFGAEVAPWVSMADALGWGATARPGWTVPAHHNGGGPDGFGGSGARAAAAAERDAGRWAALQPGSGKGNAARRGGREERDPVPVDEPAPALAFGHDAASWRWLVDRRQTGAPVVDAEASPCPTITAAAFGRSVWSVYRERVLPEWCDERPATTIAGDSRCWPPGHKVNADDRRRLGAEADERYGDRAGREAIRLSPVDALVLQSFRPDYPVQGSATKQFEQIGNAVPPLLAAHVVAAATGLPAPGAS